MLKIGTRSSLLALWQAEYVRDLLYKNGYPQDDIILEKVISSGDKVQDRYLADIGGKGLFTKELDHALLDNHIDLAVHSLKDVETFLPDGLMIAAILKRESALDVLINFDSIDAIPIGATIGTASVRRQAQLLAKRSDIKVTLLRGNIHRRLEKIQAGDVDGAILAHAGLLRMDLFDETNMRVLSVDEMIPSAGQGALAVMIKKERHDIARLLQPLHDENSALCVLCERALLAALDGSCRTPIGAYCVIENSRLHLTAMLASEDGKKIAIDNIDGDKDNGDHIAHILANKLAAIHH